MEQLDTIFGAPFQSIVNLIARLIRLLIIVVVVVNVVAIVVNALPFALTMLPAQSLQNLAQSPILAGLKDAQKGINDTQNAVNTGVITLLKEGWTAARPALELLLILGVLIWAWRSTFRGKLSALNLQWDTRTLIAMVLIGAFCVDALVDSSAASLLKDVVLVVVGFYFGTHEARGREGTETEGAAKGESKQQ